VSDDRDPTVEPSFDDPAHDELRALLADARVTEPVPDAVAARLDATLQSLRAERADEDDRAGLAPVVPLRRRLARVLVAAAAVIVVGAGGFGIARLAGGGGSAGDMSADKASTTSEGSGGGAGTPTVPGLADSLDAPEAPAAKALPHLTAAHFARDAARVMRTTYLSSLDTRSPAPTGTTDSSGQASGGRPSNGVSGSKDFGYVAPPVTATPQSDDSVLGTYRAACAGPDAPDAVIEPATLDGALVALVFRPPADAAQQVEAWSCDGSTLLATAEIGH
jgi:hypothetical protein